MNVYRRSHQPLTWLTTNFLFYVYQCHMQYYWVSGSKVLLDSILGIPLKLPIESELNHFAIIQVVSDGGIYQDGKSGQADYVPLAAFNFLPSRITPPTCVRPRSQKPLWETET